MLASAARSGRVASRLWVNRAAFAGLGQACREIQSIAVTDGRYLFDTKDRDKAVLRHSPGEPQVVTEVQLPDALVAKLGEGREKLADFDDPGNTWLFGEEGELFQYDFVGAQLARSGVVALAPSDVATSEEGVAPASAWKSISERAMKAQSLPRAELPRGVLFAGRVIGADAVAVYLLKRDKEVTGLMLVSTW